MRLSFSRDDGRPLRRQLNGRFASRPTASAAPRGQLPSERLAAFQNAITPSSTTPSPVSHVNYDQPHTLAYGAARRARILVFPPILFDSHLFIFKILAKGVQTYGHQVTFFVSDRRAIEESPDFSVRRFPGLFSSDEAGEFLQSKVTRILSGSPTLLEFFDILEHYAKNCDLIFSKGRESIEQLRQEHYDLMIVDPNEMCGFLLAKELGIPHVVFSTGMWVPHETHMPSPTSYVPEFNSLLTDRMTFLQRLYNTALYTLSNIGTTYVLFPMYDRLIKKHRVGFTKQGKPTIRGVAELVAQTQSWLLSTDIALEFSRPIMPHTEYVGGITGRSGRPLPPTIQQLVDDSALHGGFVLVSFGAGVKRLNAHLERLFTLVLSTVPYTVLWRYSHRPAGLQLNVHVMDWLPQADLLAHPNLRAFIGHGGTNGVYECIYHGVPIIGMPLFGDHYDTMVRVQAKGAGLLLHWKRLTAAHLEDAIYKIARDPTYRRAAQMLSHVYHDQPLSALERASRRIDYTIRYHGADHLRPAVSDLSFLQFFLLDVQLACLVGCLVVGWLLQNLLTALTKPAEIQQCRGGTKTNNYAQVPPLPTSKTTAATLLRSGWVASLSVARWFVQNSAFAVSALFSRLRLPVVALRYCGSYGMSRTLSRSLRHVSKDTRVPQSSCRDVSGTRMASFHFCGRYFNTV